MNTEGSNAAYPQPGVNFVIDTSAWTAGNSAALRAHRSQHLGLERIFFSKPDVDRLLGVELFRTAAGPAPGRRPTDDIIADILEGRFRHLRAAADLCRENG